MLPLTEMDNKKCWKLLAGDFFADNSRKIKNSEPDA